MKKSYLIIAAAAALSFASCKSSIKPDKPDRGDADFTKYVALGNSLTAGFADGSLYRSGQENSYPAMLANQFAMVGGGAFTQPLLLDEAGWPVLRKVLGYKPNCATGIVGLSPINYDANINGSNSTNISTASGYNNLGVPLIRCIDYAFPGYGKLNPYAARFYSGPERDGTPMAIALASDATFFSCWLGNNDVLGYATGGGVGAVGGINPGDISPTSVFKATYDALINGMVAKGAKGVLMNIPDVSATPFFTTIPANGLVLSRQGQADTLTEAYLPLGIKFNLGANYFIIEDAAAPGGLRQAKAGEYVLLTASDSLTCGGWGTRKPIPNAFVLTETEVANINEATTAFNNIIAENAERHNLAFVDMNAYLKTLAAGVTWNGITYTPTFITGGAFSLDGIHLTQRGYALATNEIIKAINRKYNATLGMVDANNYKGITFP